jgi:cobalt/nickel transport system permease protein
MILHTPFAQGNSIIHRLEPRTKLLIALLFNTFLATSDKMITLLAALTLTSLLAIIAQLPWQALFQRLLALNLFNLLMFLTLPFSTPGENNYHFSMLTLNQTGIWQATLISLKSNNLLLILTTLLSTTNTIALGYAFHQLHVPDKLTHLFLFTVRYLTVLYQEYQRLWQAMKVRGFQAGFNKHTYRSFAYLISMLLIKSIDRAERISAAMKCRGFRGQFFLLKPNPWQRHDQIFSFFSLSFLIILLGIEWIA